MEKAIEEMKQKYKIEQDEIYKPSNDYSMEECLALENELLGEALTTAYQKGCEDMVKKITAKKPKSKKKK